MEKKPRFRHSLRYRIILGFCIFGVGLAVFYAGYIMLSMTFVEDALFNHRLKLELDDYIARYMIDPNTPLPHTSRIKAYIGTDRMTPFEKKLIKRKRDGVRESRYKDYHVAVKTLPDRSEKLYLIYDVGALEIHSTRIFRHTIPEMTGGLILVVLLARWIGVLISRKVIAPVIQLADQMGKTDPTNLPTNISDQFYDDEVGVLAKAMDRAMRRIESFIKREKNFTRDASHELRTPVTVIKGAVELLQKQKNEISASQSHALARIERAIKDMENIIESFLWLAREEDSIDGDQTCSPLPIIQETIEQHRYLIEDKDIVVEINADTEPRIKTQAPIFKILMANLIRNAFQYTRKGKVTISLFENRIEVSDTGPGIPMKGLDEIIQPHKPGEESQGFGIGLSIVKRLCDRLKWNIEIESDEREGSTVTLFFEKLAKE